jgi:hypothetical protein
MLELQLLVRIALLLLLPAVLFAAGPPACPRQGRCRTMLWLLPLLPLLPLLHHLLLATMLRLRLLVCAVLLLLPAVL